MSNYYEILQLPKDCTTKEIEQQYSILAKQYHPDKDHGDQNTYLKIKDAYLFLKDKYKRRFYDTFGEKSLSYFKDEKSAYLFTRCFDRLNVFFLTLIFLTFLCSYFAFPLFLYFKMRNDKIKYICFFSFILLALALFLICILRALHYLRKARIGNYKHECLTIYGLFTLTLLSLIQLLFLVLHYDKILDTYRVLLLIPYIGIEIILTIQLIINLKAAKQKYIDENLSRLLLLILNRIFFMTVLLIDFDTRIKYGLFVLFLAIDMYFRNVHWLVVLLVTCFMGSYVCGCLNYYFETKRIWMNLFFVPPFLAIGFVLVMLRKQWVSALPKSMFIRQKMLIGPDDV